MGVKMFTIYTLENKDEWIEIIKGFQDIDIYYYPEYVEAYLNNGDGIPQLIHYINDDVEVVNVVIKRDISNHPNFVTTIESSKYFDFITPYGYGGPLFKNKVSIIEEEQFYYNYKDFCRKHGIISEFIRFSPTLKNYLPAIGKIETLEVGPTVTLSIYDKDLIWEKLHAKNKNSIRKSVKNKVKIYWGRSLSLMKEFKEMYYDTMTRDHAQDYYYFSDEFFDSILSDLKYNMLIFYAEMDAKIISMSIVLFSNNSLHYHLSASKYEYRKYSPSNLLLYEIALFGQKNGYTIFHLGGGLSGELDNLYKYKKSFNIENDTKFITGKLIFNKEVYEYLSNLTTGDYDSKFFPKYRIVKK